jgi:hypothetical protein
MIEPADAIQLQTDTALEPTEVYAQAEHLIAFTGEPWAFWRWSGLRGAGFPAHRVLKLAVPTCAAAADKILAAEKKAAECKTEAIAIFRLALDQSEDKELRRPLSRALSHLNKGRVPDLVGDTFGDACRTLASAYAQVGDARKAFKEEFANGVLGTSNAIRDIAYDPHFRQAVLIQNSAAIHRVLHAFSATPIEKRGFKERQNEEMVASYLQRYCVKNDTIGFFGPVGWAMLGRKVSDIAVSSGPNLVATSSICFENWCIEALAEKVAENPAVRRWIPPRRLPEFYLDGSTLRSPAAPLNALPSQQLAILQLCDGERTGRQIASTLVGSCGFGSDDEVYSLLAEFTKKNVLSWAYDLPLVLHPEKLLRQLLDRIDDEQLRLPALASLDRLEQARNNVAAAFGDADQLSIAVKELEQLFEDVTGSSGSRLGGKTYASRTLFYQDCRRDVDVDVGPAVLESITPPLSLVLTSARWFSHRVASVCREGFIKAHTMMARTPAGTVELLRFLKYTQLLLFSRNPAINILTPVLEDLQNRWKRILGPLPQARHVDYASAHLRPQVDDLFAAPGPGWPLARHHSPDVMIAAGSIDAIRRGECFFVLGEVHVTANTLNSSLFVAQHPRPDELCRAMASDFPKARPILMFPRTWPRIMNRSVDAWIAPYDYHIEVSRDTIYPGVRSQAIPASAFVVKNLGNRVVVCTRDGRLEFDAIEFFGEMLTRASVASYDFMRVFNSGGYNPRITIDRLVVARESWRFPARSLEFIHEEDEHLRYLQARRWMHQHNLPRFVFFKVPVEVKPFYLDFESPIYVEILVKMIRRVLASDQAEESVLVSEMVPGHGELWLPDAKGNIYTSELRLVVRDLLG